MWALVARSNVRSRVELFTHVFVDFAKVAAFVVQVVVSLAEARALFVFSRR